MRVKDLNPATYNPRKISAKQLAALKKSMAEFGDLSGVVVNVRTGNVIGGHQRLKNLDPEWPIKKQPTNDNTGTMAAGHIDTPWGMWQYREVDWDETKEKAANLAANKHGGEWDLPKLDIVLNELKEIDFDLELTGFDLKVEANGDFDRKKNNLKNGLFIAIGFCDFLVMPSEDEFLKIDSVFGKKSIFGDDIKQKLLHKIMEAIDD